MRIISGDLKGKKLSSFSHDSTRPTLDNVKEAFFNIIFDKVKGNFLDLFAGTGGIGFEAYSRGSQRVVLVDNNINAVKNILNNIENLKVDERLVLLSSDYVRALKKLSKNNLKFDVVFLDPPYNSDFAENAITNLVSLNLLNKDALIVWEHDKSKLDKLDGFSIKKLQTKKYGHSFLTVYLNE